MSLFSLPRGPFSCLFQDCPGSVRLSCGPFSPPLSFSARHCFHTAFLPSVPHFFNFFPRIFTTRLFSHPTTAPHFLRWTMQISLNRLGISFPQQTGVFRDLCGSFETPKHFRSSSFRDPLLTFFFSSALNPPPSFATPM